jgi:hypothetical protein
VVVLPVPLTPTMRITAGTRVPSSAFRAVASRRRSIAGSTRVSSSPCRTSRIWAGSWVSITWMRRRRFSISSSVAVGPRSASRRVSSISSQVSSSIFPLESRASTPRPRLPERDSRSRSRCMRDAAGSGVSIGVWTSAGASGSGSGSAGASADSAASGSAGASGSGLLRVCDQSGFSGFSTVVVGAGRVAVVVELPWSLLLSWSSGFLPRERTYAQTPAPMTTNAPPPPASRARMSLGSTGHLRDGECASRRSRPV